MRITINGFLSLTLLMWSSMASAFYGDGLLVNSTLMNFKFEEYDETGRVLSEKGLLAGAELEVGKSFGPVWGGVRGSFLKGTADYSGQTQGGTPHETKTDETIYDFTVEIGRNYETWRREEFATIYAGLGFHQWVRDIRTRANPITGKLTTGLYERYTWLYANVGARGFLFRTENSHAMIEINLLRTINPVMDVSFKGVYDNTRVNLGEHFGAKISLPFRYEMTRRVMFYTELYYEAWDLGFSNVETLTKGGFVDDAAASSTQEPRSTSRFAGINIGFFLRFD